MKNEKKTEILFWIVLLGCLFLGEAIGAFHARLLPEETFTETEGILLDALSTPDATNKKVFLSLLLEKGKWMLLFFLCGLFFRTTPVTFFSMGVKGYLTGFSSAFLLRVGNVPLFFYVTATEVFLNLPILFFTVRLGRLYTGRKRVEESERKRKELFRTYTLATSLIFLVLMGESMLESLIFPYLR